MHACIHISLLNTYPDPALRSLAESFWQCLYIVHDILNLLDDYGDLTLFVSLLCGNRNARCTYDTYEIHCPHCEW